MITIGQTISKTALCASASIALFAIATPAMGKDCGDLASLVLTDGKVTAATLEPAGNFQEPPSDVPLPPGVAGAAYKDLPDFCRVQVTMTPTKDSDIRVEIWLPATGWNGKLVGIGNGVWAGQLSYSQMADPVKRGFAAVTTDTGHEGSGLTAEWAVGHPEKLVDFGHRAVHLMTVAAKAAIRDYYGTDPRFSYWNSCSTGGRQGLMAAYRYPDDFDAISAMAPANPMTDLMTQSMWAASVTHRTKASALTPALLSLVHEAAVAACDRDDGTADGLIANPQACTFKPAALLCKPGQTETCLNPDQAAAMQAIYDGVQDPRSGKIILPGWPIGSEVQLAALVMGPAPFPVANDYFRLLVHGDDRAWDWSRMDFGEETEAARRFGRDVLDVPPAGLAAFFKRGGKLLLSHGWTDGLIPATNTLAFNDGLVEAIPIDQRATSLRLFMVPAMDHCGGGEGAGSFDTLGVIDDWATTGNAPERIVATRVASGFPGSPTLPPLSRPLCVWPKIATYQGAGDQSDAANFVCTMPK